MADEKVTAEQVKSQSEIVKFSARPEDITRNVVFFVAPRTSKVLAGVEMEKLKQKLNALPPTAKKEQKVNLVLAYGAKILGVPENLLRENEGLIGQAYLNEKVLPALAEKLAISGAVCRFGVASEQDDGDEGMEGSNAGSDEETLDESEVSAGSAEPADTKSAAPKPIKIKIFTTKENNIVAKATLVKLQLFVVSANPDADAQQLYKPRLNGKLEFTYGFTNGKFCVFKQDSTLRLRNDVPASEINEQIKVALARINTSPTLYGENAVVAMWEFCTEKAQSVSKTISDIWQLTFSKEIEPGQFASQISSLAEKLKRELQVLCGLAEKAASCIDSDQNSEKPGTLQFVQQIVNQPCDYDDGFKKADLYELVATILQKIADNKKDFADPIYKNFAEILELAEKNKMVKVTDKPLNLAVKQELEAMLTKRRMQSPSPHEFKAVSSAVSERTVGSDRQMSPERKSLRGEKVKVLPMPGDNLYTAKPLSSSSSSSLASSQPVSPKTPKRERIFVMPLPPTGVSLPETKSKLTTIFTTKPAAQQPKVLLKPQASGSAAVMYPVNRSGGAPSQVRAKVAAIEATPNVVPKPPAKAKKKSH